MSDGSTGLVPQQPGRERALEVIATVASAAPWLGGPVSNVITGITVERKIRRVSEVLVDLSNDLKEFKSMASEQYVKTEEFEDLLEHTLARVAKERSEAKRRLLRGFLLDAIQHPGQDYNDQLELLRILDRLQIAHLRIIRALLAPAEGQKLIAGSPFQTLRRRLPDMEPAEIDELATQLSDLRLITSGSLKTMMTGHGAQNLAHMVTPLGARFLDFVVEPADGSNSGS